MTAEQSDAITVEEAASLLAMNKRVIYRAIRKGTLPAAKIGRAFRLSRALVTGLLSTPLGGSK